MKKESIKKNDQILKKIGKYATAAGAVLLTGNLANAAINLTTTTINLSFDNSHGVDFDGDGDNELIVNVIGSIYGTLDPIAFIQLGSDADATSVEVINGGPYNILSGSFFYGPAAFPLNRIIGPTLASSSSYWASLRPAGYGVQAIIWTYNGAGNSMHIEGNFLSNVGDTKYAGIRFTNDGGTTWHYGWIGFEINNQPLAGTGTVGSIVNYAYESTADQPIYAGIAGPAVPLAPVASALGLGLVGLLGFFKSRRKKANC